MSAEAIRKKLEELPADLEKEVLDFIDFLLQKHRKKTEKRFLFDWEGGLSEFKDKYTSVELQHKASEWR
jgi:Protein of unknown function (DUF2281)